MSRTPKRPWDGWRRLAAAAATVTYLLIVLGGIVRITGSGMGCGDDWPLCNGHVFPPLDDIATVIEWGHRLVAAGVSILVGALAVWALVRRRRPEWAGRLRYGLGAVALLAIQVMLGAITVWLELPPVSVILHLGTAMALLAVLLLAALGAADRPTGSAVPGGDEPDRMSLALTGLAAAVVLLGALVANLGAAPLCQGFPLCNGSILPAGGWRVQVHWIHRLTAYALLAGAVALPFVGRSAASRTAWLAAGLTLAQVAVAAVMVLEALPETWRALHVAFGTAVFAAFVAHTHLTRRPGTAS